MIIMPYSTHLRFNQFPYITFGIIILCMLIYLLQVTNESEIDGLAYNYCKEINIEHSFERELDILRQENCQQLLFYFHQRKEHGALELLESFNDENDVQLSESEKRRQLEILQQHLDEFQYEAPDSFTGKLLYYPSEVNVFRMLTSSIAHGDFGHILFNLIFFLAFAPAIEIIIGRSVTYIAILTGMTVVTSISYSLYIFMGQATALPTLGLSGLVMGVIGLSAYLMPNARIKMFIWVKTFLIPAWMVAIWYIGWDIWNILSQEGLGGVNLVSHISGGVAGYVLGVVFLKERRAETREELNQEIKDLRFNKTGQRQIQQRLDEKETQKDHSRFIIQMQRCAQSGRDVEGLLFLLEDHEQYTEEVFSELKPMGHSRLLLCIGRYMIHHFIEQKNYSKALYYIEQCQQEVQYFVLAHPEHTLFMAHIAMNNHQYKLAFHLVSQAWERYGEAVDIKKCAFLEIELLSHFMNRSDKSKERITQLKMVADGRFKKDILELEKLLS